MSAVSAVECVASTGRPMTEDRPRPQYGEYATPEQQAAAMGQLYVPPAPTQPVAPAPQTIPAESRLAPPGNRADRFATIFLLGIGLAVLINSDFFHLSENLNPAFEELGLAFRVSSSVDALGPWLLGANIVALLATMAAAYRRLRQGRLSFYIPLVGYVVFTLIVGLVIYLHR
jgi:Family of unknown function (DUF6264)